MGDGRIGLLSLGRLGDELALHGLDALLQALKQRRETADRSSVFRQRSKHNNKMIAKGNTHIPLVAGAE